MNVGFCVVGEVDFGGGARVSGGESPSSALVETARCQHARETDLEDVRKARRLSASNRRAVTRSLATQTVKSGTTVECLPCSRAAHTDMYRSAHHVSWASRRAHGKSNLLCAARLGRPLPRRCTALPQGCRQPSECFRHPTDGPLKPFWVAPGTFHNRHSCSRGKARR